MDLRDAATRGQEAVTSPQESPGSMDYFDDEPLESETKGEKPSHISLPSLNDQVDPPPKPSFSLSLCNGDGVLR